MTVTGTPVRPTDPLVQMWNLLGARRYPAPYLKALFGTTPRHVDDVSRRLIALHDRTDVLLERTPDLLRTLPAGTASSTERCVGDVRGPIDWSETITAWSSGLGVDDVFVCRSSVRDYDLAENRVLAWLLRRVVVAGHHLEENPPDWATDAEVETIRTRARQAARHSQHPFLRDLRNRRPSAAEIRHAKSSRHAVQFRDVFPLIPLAIRPLVDAEIHRFADPLSLARLDALTLLMAAVAERDVHVPAPRLSGGAVVVGPIRYTHSTDVSEEGGGIDFAGVLIEGASRHDAALDAQIAHQLAARAQGREFVSVRSIEDARHAVDKVLARHPTNHLV